MSFKSFFCFFFKFLRSVWMSPFEKIMYKWKQNDIPLCRFFLSHPHSLFRLLILSFSRNKETNVIDTCSPRFAKIPNQNCKSFRLIKMDGIPLFDISGPRIYLNSAFKWILFRQLIMWDILACWHAVNAPLGINMLKFFVWTKFSIENCHLTWWIGGWCVFTAETFCFYYISSSYRIFVEVSFLFRRNRLFHLSHCKYAIACGKWTWLWKLYGWWNFCIVFNGCLFLNNSH